MSETLTRIYHEHTVISVKNGSPVEESDGWLHQIGGETFHTLADAIQYA